VREASGIELRWEIRRIGVRAANGPRRNGEPKP
jgi:hypothetical protein